MSRRFIRLAVLILLIPALPGTGQEVSDEEAIHLVLTNYIEAWRDADYDRLRDVFDPAGHVYWLTGDEDSQHLQSMTFEQILARDPRPRPSYGLQWEVRSLSIIDGHLAAAELGISRKGGSYVDVLLLHKIVGSWRIVTKTFAVR